MKDGDIMANINVENYYLKLAPDISILNHIEEKFYTGAQMYPFETVVEYSNSNTRIVNLPYYRGMFFLYLGEGSNKDNIVVNLNVNDYYMVDYIDRVLLIYQTDKTNVVITGPISSYTGVCF